MVVDTSLYEQLGVNPTATQGELKKAYHKFALANHPDKVPESDREEAHEKFQKAQCAYEILRDPESRILYDERGLDGFKGGQFDQEMGFDPDLAEFLNHMFGAGPRGPGGWAEGASSGRSADAIKEFPVTLEELYSGKHVRMMIKRKVVCQTCKGRGAKAGAKHKKCSACSGSGEKVLPDIFGRYMRTTCPDCNGSGTVIHPKERCKKCKGAKLVEAKKPLDFWIEKGMEDRAKVVLKGEADQEPDNETGDLIFVVDEQTHPVFLRLGSDLKATLKISLEEALCGFSRVILTSLDGRELMYTHKVEEKGIIRPKDIFKIAGEGMPLGKKSDEKGDLYLDVEIEFPRDDWVSNPTKVDLLRSVFASASSIPLKQETNGVSKVVDEVELEKTDADGFGGDAAGWETESEGESEGVQEQCTTQ